MSSGFGGGSKYVHTGSFSGCLGGLSRGFDCGYGVGVHRDMDRVFSGGRLQGRSMVSVGLTRGMDYHGHLGVVGDV